MLKALYQKINALLSQSESHAAQAWQAESGDAQHAFWLFAAPVSMVAGRDSFYMADSSPVVLSQDESVALIQSLNEHFSMDGWHFYLQNGIWFLGLDDDPGVVLTHLDKVKGQDVGQYLPHGEGALHWNSLQNEVQMLLFTHPVNQAREAQNLPVINSLWCYGLGASQ